MKNIILALVFLVSMAHLAPTTPSGPHAYDVLKSSACIRSEPNISKKCLLNLKAGEKTILRSGLKNNFYKVQYKGKTGWIGKNSVNIIYP
jgi:hypothetical protein